MPEKSPGRPAGRRNTKPSKAAIAGYYRLLAGAADHGDPLAAGLLVVNDTIDGHLARERSDRIEREAEVEGGTVEQICGRTRRRLLDLIDQMEEGEPRDAASLQQGQGLRDAAPANPTGNAGSAAGGTPVSGESDSRRIGQEHPTHAEQETSQ